MTTRKATIIVLALLACGVRNSWEEEAKPCDSDNCYIPECRCTSKEIPGNLKKDDTPQIVMLTFDDAVSVLLHDKFYKTLLNEDEKQPVKFKNPNGCNIGMTFFTSHEYCDYVLVHDLWTKGHEIASHSISHKSDQNYWKKGDAKMWYDELVGMRKILNHFALIPEKDVVGVRVPFLQPGGNTQFQVMQDNKFLWDCSMPTRTQVNPGIWPYSLDYRSTQECQIPKCPTDSFPGLWVVPMLDLFDKEDNPCAMLDTCIADLRNETKKLLLDNFYRSYNGTRAPFGLFVHAAWFLHSESQEHWYGYLDFLTEVTKLKDVYFVTVSQALEWSRHPVPLSRIHNWSKWQNQCTPKPNECGKPQLCKAMKQEEWGPSERYMRICQKPQCPDVYPWVGNPLGVEE